MQQAAVLAQVGDDAFGQRLESETRPSRVAGYGFQRGAVVGEKLRLSQSGLHLRVHTDWGNAEFEAPLLGRFNAANLLAVLTTLLVSGVKLDDACKALAHIQAPPGRMQTLGGDEHPLVVVDYAHTPDALEKAQRAEEIVRKRLKYRVGVEPEEMRFDYVGLNALHGPTAPALDCELNEVGLRVAARLRTREEADLVRREATHLWTLGGIGTAFGVPFPIRPVVSLWPTLVPRDAVQLKVTIEEV